MPDAIAEARRIRRQLTVMVFDIDDFKTYNDRYGHSAGDTILRETVQLLGSTIRDGDRVCRDRRRRVRGHLRRHAGATEHGVHPPRFRRSHSATGSRSRSARCGSPSWDSTPRAPLSISGGLASFPWDGHDGDELLHIADQRALESKRRGKNCLTIGPGARTQWPEHE